LALDAGGESFGSLRAEKEKGEYLQGAGAKKLGGDPIKY
jgi:hypothetical protein